MFLVPLRLKPPLLPHLRKSVLPPLITNAIIYYNTVLLSRVYEQNQAAGDQEAQIIILLWFGKT